MTLIAPDVDSDFNELRNHAEAAPVELTFDQALELRRDLHRARARLIQRNRGTGCDWNDVRAVETIERQWLALNEELRGDVDATFRRRDHPCAALLTCPWGREP